MKRSLAFFVGVLFLGASPGGAGDPTKDDLKALQGKWESVLVTHLGKQQEDQVKFELKGKVLIYSEVTADEITLDSAKTPRQFELKDQKNKVFLGIYEVNGGEWKMCLRVQGEGRPKAFESKEGSGDRLMILKRVKP